MWCSCPQNTEVEKWKPSNAACQKPQGSLEHHFKDVVWGVVQARAARGCWADRVVKFVPRTVKCNSSCYIHGVLWWCREECHSLQKRNHLKAKIMAESGTKDHGGHRVRTGSRERAGEGAQVRRIHLGAPLEPVWLTLLRSIHWQRALLYLGQVTHPPYISLSSLVKLGNNITCFSLCCWCSPQHCTDARHTLDHWATVIALQCCPSCGWGCVVYYTHINSTL